MEPETLLRIQPSYKVTVMPSTLQMVLIHYLYTYGTLTKKQQQQTSSATATVQTT